MLSLLSLLSIRLTDHIFHNDIKDFSNRIAILQYLPRLIRMEMNLHQIFITGCDQAVAFKMLCNIICDVIFIQIFVSSLDQ